MVGLYHNFGMAVVVHNVEVSSESDALVRVVKVAYLGGKCIVVVFGGAWIA